MKKEIDWKQTGSSLARKKPLCKNLKTYLQITLG